MLLKRLSIQIALLMAFACQLNLSAEEDDLTPPPEIRKLLDAGKVQWEYYDARQQWRRFPGETRFNMSFDHTFRMQYELVRRGDQTIGANVTLTEVEVTPVLDHKITLPAASRGAGQWNARLMRHELDHLAISVDPRVLKILKELYRTTQPKRFDLQPDETFSTDWLSEKVNDELNQRGQAVIALVSFNYRLLDKVSQHGQKTIPERAEFFGRLYTKANLDEAEFPYTGQVLELLKSEEYTATELLYLP